MLRSINYDVTILTDTTLTAMRRGMEDFARKATVCNTAVLYYSGHGIQIENDNYLIPVDAEIEMSDSIEYQCVRMDWAEEKVATARSLGMVLLDACRDNPFLNQLRKNDPLKANYKLGLAAVEPDDYFLVSYATAPNKAARDGTANELSPYAKALVTHLPVPGLSIQDAFGRVITSVCDLTSGASPENSASVDAACQRPYIRDNLGAVQVFMTDQPGDAVLMSPFPILTNVKMADPADAAVEKLLGKDNTQFSFRYVWKEPESSGGRASVFPDLDYFASLQARGRPLIVAEQVGFYSPDISSGTWSLSYPLLDVISRKISVQDLQVAEIVFESDNSREDRAPYVNMIVESVDFAGVTLINEGWMDVSSGRLEFDVIGFKDLDQARIEELIKTKGESSYTHTMAVKPFKEDRKISLKDEIRSALSDLPMYEFLTNHQVSLDKNGKLNIFDAGGSKKVGSIKGFESWFRERNSRLGDEEQHPFWIVGRLTVSTADGQTSVADFGAPLSLVNPGVGAPSLNYDLVDFINLPIDGQRHVIHKPIGKLLNKEQTTFRGLYPLVTRRSSFHDLRFMLRDKSGADLFVSPWIEMHIVVSRPAKNAVISEKKLPY